MCEDDSQMREPDLVNECWLGILKDGEYAGFFRIAQITSVLFECHVCILKEHRGESDKYAYKAYEWILENLEAEKLILSIPEFNKAAITYAKKIGFVNQGYNCNSYKREGKLCAMLNLGITKKEMGDMICRQQP